MNRRRTDTLAVSFGLTPATTANSADEKARAARYVAAHATDHDDARRLLEALGLTTTGEGNE